ncbi:MAG TPA: alpha/beta hydrolase [Tepidisphaeraceae bacterium]|jgi:alpha-beta hydrolase superfamily lysophospholipase|nr:alpha/beta hydrolase [Tepidisphaeraceae bacterium]
MTIEEGHFASGGLQLFRRALRVERPLARVLVLHGYGDHSGRYEPFMRSLAGAGIESHAYDFRGHGRSGGRRGFVSPWDQYLDDLQAFVATVPSDVPQFVVGHSHGGLVTATAVERGMLAQVGGVVLCSPFLVSAVVVPFGKRILAAGANLLIPAIRIANGLKAEMMTDDPDMLADARQDPLLLRSATPRWYHGVTRAQPRVMRDAGQFTLPLQMLIGTDDVIASPLGNRQFFQACAAGDKSLIEYPGMRHELLRESGRAKVFHDIHQWIIART